MIVRGTKHSTWASQLGQIRANLNENKDQLSVQRFVDTTYTLSLTFKLNL